jgi:hypothetical protein
MRKSRTNAEEEQMKRNVAALLAVLFLLCVRPLRAKAEPESGAAAEECGIRGISVLQTAEDGVQVRIVFATGKPAKLVVALYDAADDRVMLACGEEEVDTGQEQCEIFAAWKNEAEAAFQVAAYLIEPKSMTLLCPSAYILRSDAEQAGQSETEADTSEPAEPGTVADFVDAPYETAYLLAYTAAQKNQDGIFLTDPFGSASLLYLAQRSGEELLTFVLEVPQDALVICTPCDFADAPVLLQEAETGEETTGTEASEGAPSAIDALSEEGKDAGGSTGDGVEVAAAPGGAESNAEAAVVSQSIASGSAASGTQALWMAAAGAGILAAAVLAKKVIFSQSEEQTIRLDLQIGRWVLRLSHVAAAQPAQQGQQSRAPAEEQAAAANG